VKPRDALTAFQIANFEQKNTEHLLCILQTQGMSEPGLLSRARTISS